MRKLGIGLWAVGIFAALWADNPTQAASPTPVTVAIGVAELGHHPGPAHHGRHWHPHPRRVCRPWIVLPPPPPPLPRVYSYYYSVTPLVPSYYGGVHGGIYYSSPRAGIVISW